MVFANPSRHISRNLHKIGEHIILGQAQSDRTVFTAQGKQSVAYNLDIYAKLPGKNK